MNRNILFLIVLTLLFCVNVSCVSNAQISKSYTSYTLNHKETPEAALKHKSWKIVDDSPNCDIHELLNQGNKVYRIKYNHDFDSISIPKGIELYFCGGSLRGKIKFNDNYLSGKVNLKESEISGNIINTILEAGWICYGDGLHDDAKSINQAISVCQNIHFQKGTYLLESFHAPNNNLTKSLQIKVKSHIGIYKSGISIYGDVGASFLTKDKVCTLCIYTLPYQIKNSIKDIEIKNLDFRVVNDSSSFNEFCHTIKIVGVNGLKISDCNFFDFWGDAICLCHYEDDAKTGERTRNSNVVIENNYIEGESHNNRNGISVINGDNVLIDNNRIEETSKKGMPGAIDVEANNSAYTINQITISNNEISGSRGSGAAIAVVCNKKNAPAYNIKILNNKIKDSHLGLGFTVASQNTSGSFTIANNFVDIDTPPYGFHGKGSSKNWTFKGNSFKRSTLSKIGGNINIENLRILQQN